MSYIYFQLNLNFIEGLTPMSASLHPCLQLMLPVWTAFSPLSAYTAQHIITKIKCLYIWLGNDTKLLLKIQFDIAQVDFENATHLGLDRWSFGSFILCSQRQQTETKEYDRHLVNFIAFVDTPPSILPPLLSVCLHS